MKKQVATILGNMAHEVEQCEHKDPALGLAIKQATLEICQRSQERAERIKREIEEGMAGLDLQHPEYYSKRDFAVIPVETWKSLWEKGLG